MSHQTQVSKLGPVDKTPESQRDENKRHECAKTLPRFSNWNTENISHDHQLHFSGEELGLECQETCQVMIELDDMPGSHGSLLSLVFIK